MIRYSFFKCGIRNALDGTQDDALFEDLCAPNDGQSDDVDDNTINQQDAEDVIVPLDTDDESDFEGF